MLEEEKVVQLFPKGVNCAMQVFGDLAPRLGLEQDTAYRIAAAFGGGLDQDGPCGAVSGALMALGLACGNYRPGDLEGKMAFLAKKREFEEEFLNRFPGLSCSEVLGCDRRTDEGKCRILQEGLVQKLCAPACCAAAEIVEEMLELD